MSTTGEEEGGGGQYKRSRHAQPLRTWDTNSGRRWWTWGRNCGVRRSFCGGLQTSAAREKNNQTILYFVSVPFLVSVRSPRNLFSIGTSPTTSMAALWTLYCLPALGAPRTLCYGTSPRHRWLPSGHFIACPAKGHSGLLDGKGEANVLLCLLLTRLYWTRRTLSSTLSLPGCFCL